MATEGGRADARRAVMRLMAERDWNPARLATEAGIDYGTAGDFLNGKRWPKVGTLGKIDRALGWTPGTLAAIGEELQAPPRADPLARATTAALLSELARRLGLAAIIDDGMASADRSPGVTPGPDAEGVAVSPPPPPAPNQQSRPGGPDRRRHQ